MRSPPENSKRVPGCLYQFLLAFHAFAVSSSITYSTMHEAKNWRPTPCIILALAHQDSTRLPTDAGQGLQSSPRSRPKRYRAPV